VNLEEKSTYIFSRILAKTLQVLAILTIENIGSEWR